jgi:hypothetical protein
MVDFDQSGWFASSAGSIVQRCVEAHERRSVVTQTKAMRGKTSERVKARRGSAGGHRVTPTRPERTLRVRKSSKSQADEPHTWRARISVIKNGTGDRSRRKAGPLPGRENL